MSKYSQAEIEMFAELGYGYLLSTSLQPIHLYRSVAEDLFIEKREGPGVEAMRRCMKAIQNGKPYRMTPEFDRLIEESYV